MPSICHEILWLAITTLCNFLADRSVALSLNQCHSDHYRLKARLLARRGTLKLVMSALCRCAQGRQFVSHTCRLLCSLGNSGENPRRLVNMEESILRVYFYHALQCPVSKCKFYALEIPEWNDHVRNAHRTFLEHKKDAW